MMLLILASQMQSALEPAANEAGHIANLWWLYFWVFTAVFALVAAFLFLAISKSNQSNESKIEHGGAPPAGADRKATRVVTSCLIATILILFTLLVIDFFTGNAIYATPDPNAMTIRVVGHQWWWEVEYRDPHPDQIMRTANEIHVPVGKPVKLQLQSTDVIHSFWVPNMHGKKDLIPGQQAETWFVANREGEFRGQCAEYCGEQHAHMRMIFIAQKQSDFDVWMTAQKQSAPEPTSDSERRGRDVFTSSQCMMCHTIQGTNARAALGPDLTHIGSRKLIAAGEMPNTRENMTQWINNPQNFKPGTRMPPNQFPDQDLNALVDYLESLK